MKPNTLARALARHWKEIGFQEKFVPHDLRRTLRTRLAELGVSDIVAERVLGHKLQGLLALYNHYPYTDEMRDALEKWNRKLQLLTGTTSPDAGNCKVIQLNGYGLFNSSINNNKVVAAAADGQCPPDVATNLLQGLGTLARITEIQELRERLEALERTLKKMKKIDAWNRRHYFRALIFRISSDFPSMIRISLSLITKFAGGTNKKFSGTSSLIAMI